MIDRKESLIIETNDDTKDNSYEAAGLLIIETYDKPLLPSYKKHKMQIM